jgi:multidrug efflux pump
VAVLSGFLYLHMPTSFVPDEDQGFLLALVNLPPDATLQRTEQVMTQLRATLLHSPIGKDITGIFQPEGFSFVGNSENVGMAFIKLADWSKRPQSVMQLIPQVNKLAARVSGAQIFAVNLPTIRGLSRFGGIDLYLLARTGQTHQQLDVAAQTLVTDAGKDPMLYQVRENALPSASQLNISVNRKQAASMGLSLSDVYATVDTEIAPMYIDQMSYGGRIKQVYIQDQPEYRMGPGALEQLYTPSADSPLNSSKTAPAGTGAPTTGVDGMIPLSSVIDAKWSIGPAVLQRYNGYPALEVVGNPASNYTTGQAMASVQGIVRKALPPGYGAEWTGQSYQELLSGNSAPELMGLSILVVFLGLAALYESWSIPIAVLLVVPLGLLGMIAFCMVTHVPNDVYFKIGLVTVIGLAAKNAILIVEFAVQSQAAGSSLFDAVTTAARLRLRPILMTSFAFILGVLPLLLSSGAGAVSRHEIGTGVIGGMLFATVFGLLLIPVFYVTVRRVLGDLLHHSTPAAGSESPQ